MLRLWALCVVCLNKKVRAADCLLGCTLQDMSPFSSSSDWDDSAVCDASNVGCNVIVDSCQPNSGYPDQYKTDLCIWSSRIGTAGVLSGDDACICNVCAGLYGSPSSWYMSDTPIWDRLRCYIAAAELKGFDMSPCVGSVLNKTMPCVDSADWTNPTVEYTDCSAAVSTDTDESLERQCAWNGTVLAASSLFTPSPTTPAPIALPVFTPSPSATSSPVVAPSPVPVEAPTAQTPTSSSDTPSPSDVPTPLVSSTADPATPPLQSSPSKAAEPTQPSVPPESPTDDDDGKADPVYDIVIPAVSAVLAGSILAVVAVVLRRRGRGEGKSEEHADEGAVVAVQPNMSNSCRDNFNTSTVNNGGGESHTLHIYGDVRNLSGRL